MKQVPFGSPFGASMERLSRAASFAFSKWVAYAPGQLYRDWGFSDMIRHLPIFGEVSGVNGGPRAGSMIRRDLVLAILAAANGRTFTPVQIQKTVFVVCDNLPHLIDDGPGFHFKPYDYGPFDSDVYSEINALGHDGLAVIAPSGYGNWNTYAATDAGIRLGNSILHEELEDSDRAYIERVSTWVRSLTFSSLVKSIYEAYPDMKVRSVFRG